MNLEDFLVPNLTQLEFIPTLFNFFMCILMSFIVRDFYIKRSFSLSGKMHIGSILPILSAVVFLVIIVVKTSLALSLGLVGALSIVRFRTPIKEPEELVYLFLAIAIGLGYAAGQVVITTTVSLLIILIIHFWLSNKNVGRVSEYNLIIKWENREVTFDDIVDQISPVVESLKLSRLDKGPSGNTSVLLVTPKIDQSIEVLSSKISELDDSAHVTFFESKSNW
jgi:hypothetical protein